MNSFFYSYIVLWSSCCVIAFIVLLTDKDSFALFHLNYWRFLFKPWKIMTSCIAVAGMTFIAPFTGDPTWDYFDALFMSLLTYLSAPWAIGAIYKAVTKELPLKQAYVAFCAWMLSASWSYDLYLLIRDGSYPITWFANIFASSILYISAGLFWNLGWVAGRGVVFSFMLPDWPTPSVHSAFQRIIWYALPFMGLTTFLILYFFLF